MDCGLSAARQSTPRVRVTGLGTRPAGSKFHEISRLPGSRVYQLIWLLPLAVFFQFIQNLPECPLDRSVRLAVGNVPWHTFVHVRLGAVDFETCHSKYQGRRRQSEAFGFNCCGVDLPCEAFTFAEKCHYRSSIRRCEMTNPTLISELHNKLGTPSSEAVECLRLVKAFLRLEPGQRFEVIELVELLAADPSFELDLPLS